MILLDTSVLIELFRAKDKTQTLFFQLAANEEDFAISSLTHYEVFIGSNDTQNKFWEDLLQVIQIIPFDMECSQRAVEIYKDLKKRNKLIELTDLVIAATAIAKGCPIVTRNTKHFDRIKNLSIIDS